MKKIINGKVYDTAKAKQVGTTWSNNDDARDFNHYTETLYRKRTGEYFIHGEGGPASKYRRAMSQNCWSGSEEISSLTHEEARIWAEEHLDADEYASEFGVIEDDDTTSSYTLILNSSLVDRVRRLASAQGKTLSQTLDDVLRAGLEATTSK